MNKKGFTLIELLVVIAIIGIIAGVIVVSMDGSSDKARAARIKSEMDNIRTRMEILRADNATSTGSYTYEDDKLGDTGESPTDAEILKLYTDIIAQGATTPVKFDTTAGYCFEVVLPGTGNWCIDSSGYAGTTADCDITNDCAAD